MAAEIPDPPRSFAPVENDASDGAPHRLRSADRLDGVVVYDRVGVKVAVIADIAVDEATGKVAYAILSHGGLLSSFLGLGRRYHPVPWSLLHYDARRNGYVLPLDRRTLDAAPSYEAGAPGEWDDGGYRDEVHRYYGAAPYWA